MRGQVDTAPLAGRMSIRTCVAWLMKLPKPVGVLACFDTCGRHVLEACRIAGLRVPDDVAVIGVDNDPLLCELADPPLSSVAPDARQAGYLAATLLDRMMAGGKVPSTGHFVRPRGIATRRSTDVTAIVDPDISAAVRFIRDNALPGDYSLGHSRRGRVVPPRVRETVRGVGRPHAASADRSHADRTGERFACGDRSSAEDDRRTRRCRARGIPQHALPQGRRTDTGSVSPIAWRNI